MYSCVFFVEFCDHRAKTVDDIIRGRKDFWVFLGKLLEVHTRFNLYAIGNTGRQVLRGCEFDFLFLFIIHTPAFYYRVE